MAGFTNYDYDTEQKSLDRRQAIADALLKGGLAPLDLPTQPGVKVAGSQVLAKLFQAYTGQSAQPGIDEGRKDLTARYKNDLASGIEQYNNTMAPKEVPFYGPTATNAQGQEIPNPNTVTQKPDPRKAIADLIASNHPALQKLGFDSFQNSLKTGNGLSLKDLFEASNAEGKAALAATNDPSKFIPKADELGTLSSDSILFDKRLKEVVALRGQNPQTKETSGGLVKVNQSTGDISQVNKAPVVNVKLPENIKENEYTKTIQSGRSKAVVESYEAAKALPESLQSLKRASDVLKEGIVAGVGADQRLFLGKVGQALGLAPPDPKLSNTEEYKAAVIKRALEYVKDLKPATELDLKKSLEAAGGDPTLEATALQNIINAGQAEIYTKLFRHNALLSKELETKEGAGAGLETFDVPFTWDASPGDFTIGRNNIVTAKRETLPNTTTGRAGAPAVAPSASDYIKQQLGR